MEQIHILQVNVRDDGRMETYPRKSVLLNPIYTAHRNHVRMKGEGGARNSPPPPLCARQKCIYLQICA